MDAPAAQHTPGELKASKNIVALQIRKFGKQVLDRVAARKILKNRLHRIPQPPDTRLPVANLRINRNSAH